MFDLNVEQILGITELESKLNNLHQIQENNELYQLKEKDNEN